MAWNSRLHPRDSKGRFREKRGGSSSGPGSGSAAELKAFKRNRRVVAGSHIIAGTTAGSYAGLPGAVAGFAGGTIGATYNYRRQMKAWNEGRIVKLR